MEMDFFLNANHVSTFTFLCHNSLFHGMKNCHRQILTTSILS